MLNYFMLTKKTRQFLSKKISIPSDQNMSQGEKCFNTPILYTTSRHLIFRLGVSLKMRKGLAINNITER